MRLRDDTPDEQRIGARDLTQWRTGAGRMLAALALRFARRVGTWGVANWVLVLTALVGLGLTSALTATAEDVYEGVVESDGISGLDRPVLDAAVALRSPGFNRVVTVFTDLGGPVVMPVLATVAVVVLTVLWRSRTPLVLMLVGAAGSLAMTTVGKDFVGRARPPQSLAVPPFETSPSFPSGHTLNATVVTGVLVYLLLRRQRSLRARTATLLAGAFFVAAMGLSRVYLGHHWLSDVVMGWVLGLAWLVAVVTAHRLYLTVRRAGTDADDDDAEVPAHAEPRSEDGRDGEDAQAGRGRSTTQWSPSSRNPSRW